MSDRLSGHAGEIVDASRKEGIVGIGHPGHLAFTGSHVGPGHVLSGAHEFLSYELCRESARDPFDLFRRVLLGVELNAALGTTKRDIDESALVRHQRGKGHDLVLAYQLAVARAALYRLLVLAVLRPPAFEDLVVIVESNGELKVVHVLAGFDLREKARMNLQILRCTIELLGNDAIEIEIFH